MTHLLEKLRRYARDEDGSGLVFGLYIFCVMLMIFGLAIDVANTWRNRTFLTSTADIAAHAAAVGIANGESKADIEADIVKIVKMNLPPSQFGTLIHTDTDVEFGEYDVKKYGWSSFGGTDYNGVVVKLQRSRNYGNPVTTFIMRLMNQPTFDLSARSAAVYDINGECDSSNGVFSEGKVTITTQGDIGDGYCLHSNDLVWLPQNNTFGANTMVTMQHFSQCGSKCTDAANPGIRARPAHMVFPDIAQYIKDSYDSFDTAGIPATGMKHDWFTYDPTNPSDPNITLGDTTALVAALGLGSAPVLGDIIPMTQTQFSLLPELPSGLVYNVTCTTPNGNKGLLTFDATHAVMNGAVLLTNCRIYFDAGAAVQRSVIITKAIVSQGAISAAEGTTMGDPTGDKCENANRSAIMALSDVTVPADFTLSNLTLIVDGNVNVAAISNATKGGVQKTSYGFSIYNTGYSKFASKMTFRMCAGVNTSFAPETKILRLVIPPFVQPDGTLTTGVYRGTNNENLGEIMLEKVTPGMDLTNGSVSLSNTGSGGSI